MKFIRGLINLKREGGCVATIGNFDGMHLGHQVILAQVVREARKLELPAVVVLFEPQPSEYFLGKEAVPRIMNLREKVDFLQQFGIDEVLCLHFNKRLVDLSPQHFICTLLIDGLKVKHLIVGDDFRFGKSREGDIHTLQNAAQQYSFSIDHLGAVISLGRRVSSTQVRQALKLGYFHQVKTLLGRAYTMSGRISRGDQYARTMNFPTANIFPRRRVLPITGVYAAMATLKGQTYQGVAYVTNRQVGEVFTSSLEVHIFNFNEEVYRQKMEVEFIRRLREDMTFDDVETLNILIANDIQEARAFFETYCRK